MNAARHQAAPQQKPRPSASRPRAANDNPRLRRSALVAPGKDYLFPDQIQERNVGRRNDFDRWLERQERSDELTRNTQHIADALERAGIRSREVGDQVADFDHVLGTWQAVERFRPIRFLPVIMQRDSAAMLSALRYWMHNHTLGRYVRMATITGGTRVPAFGPLRDRQQAISRAVSKWAHECETWGVSVVFRANEHTREEAEKPGDPATYHSHAHILFTPRLRMEDKQWAAFIRWSGEYFKKRLPGTLYGFHDCGRIEEPDEACKYTFKPGELMGASDAELAWLYAETYRTNQKQPLREFKDFRQQLEGNRRETGAVETVRDLDEDTGEILSEQRVTVTVRAPLKVVSVWPEDGSTAEPRLEIVHKRRKPRKEDRDETRDEDGKRRPAKQRENYILFTGNPTAGTSPYATVRSRVMGYTRTPRTEEGMGGLADLECITHQVRSYWEKRGCPSPHRIPLELELHALRAVNIARDALLASTAFRQRVGVDCATIAHQAAKDGLQKALRRQGVAVRMATRLRDALGPVEQDANRAEGASSYRVHTCSLTVRSAATGGEAEGSFSDFETVEIPPDIPPRSHYEAPETEKPDVHVTHTGERTRPVWASAPMRAEGVIPSIRVMQAEADYAAWWKATHG